MLWDVVQQVQIRQLQKRQSLVDGRVEGYRLNQQWKTESVEDKLDRLLLLCEAMWDLLSTRAGVTEEELVARVMELDAASGAVDGKRAVPAPSTCRGCGAKVGAQLRSCQFCGVPVDRNDPFSV